jgi:hypothetical protein
MIPAVVRWQIVTPQAEAAAAFYRSLFGWTVKQDNSLGYREVQSAGGRGIDGGIWPAPAGTPTMAQLFVEVADVDASIAAAVALGATVVVPRSVLPDGDTMAILVDPTGLAFGLCALAAK